MCADGTRDARIPSQPSCSIDRFADPMPLLASTEVDLKLRSFAAAAAVRGRGVLSGVSAAELLGASCGAKDAPAEVIVPGRGMRTSSQLLVHTHLLATDEVTAVRGYLVSGTVCGELIRAARDRGLPMAGFDPR